MELYQHEIPAINQSHIELTDHRQEFLKMEPFCRGLGFDIGVGTNRLSPTVLSSDWYPHKGVDLIWNCVHNGGQYPYPFSDNTFDFIFASHVLEDFEPNQLQWVFDELMRMIKPGGYFVILGPYMDGVRYPRWDEKFTAESPEVIRGERKIGGTLGNPSHLFDWNEEVCHNLIKNSKYKIELIQIDTLPKDQMTIDFVIKKV